MHNIPAPSGEPTNVTIQVLSSTSILLKWEPPQFSQQNGVISGYTVLITSLQDGSVQRHTTTGLSLQSEGDTSYCTICTIYIAKNFRGRKLSQIG